MLRFYLAHAAHGPDQGQRVTVPSLRSPKAPSLLQEIDKAGVVHTAYWIEAKIVRCNDVADRGLFDAFENQIGSLRTFKARLQLAIVELELAAVQSMIVAINGKHADLPSEANQEFLSICIERCSAGQCSLLLASQS